MKDAKKKVDIAAITPVLFLVALLVVYSFIANNFLTAANLLNVLRQVSIQGIIAVGVTLVILVGEIDLSIGTVMALCGVIVAGLSKGDFFGWAPMPVPVAMIITIIFGAIVGFCSGFPCAKLGIPGFMTTLAMQYICNGIMLMLTKGKPIQQLPKSLTFWGNGYVFNTIPTLVIFFLVIFVIGLLLLRFTVLGRNLYAIGGNAESSRLSGINVVKNKTTSFIICSVLCAIAGILMDGRLGSAQITAGDSLQMTPIAAAVLGGTSLSGGKGTMFGTLLGVLVMGILVNGLNLMGAGSDIQRVVTGVVLFAAVAFNVWSGKRAR